MFMWLLPLAGAMAAGYIFARCNRVNAAAERLLNDYVLHVALPALLFIALARADMVALWQTEFVCSTLFAIAACYAFARHLARKSGQHESRAALLAMAASYGTTGYLGLPLLLSVYGEAAALPAALATVLHNIPVMTAVILSQTDDNHAAGMEGRARWFPAFHAMIRHPLLLAVMAGVLVVLSRWSLPESIAAAAVFLGQAAGPTALFALGVGLSHLRVETKLFGNMLLWKIIFLKTLLMPALLACCAVFVFGMKSDDLWFVSAVLMAAQPVGAGAYVFAKQYDGDAALISMAIVLSLPLSVCTLSVLLYFFAIIL